ncbi:MAG: sugar transferase [Gemmatimonadaceae bacterium]|nr:sugar transferase [Gemmatimonadaceae bacterium]
MKRLFDILVSAAGLLGGSVVLLPTMFLVWLQDRHSPFYIAPRMARSGGTFRMVKLRSMRILADKTGVTSTAGDDPRITAVGRFIRKFKLDEVTQLWNVLKGDMSLVGPRPQVEADARLYTEVERRMLDVRPGITDLASIVFADEGEILRGSANPDLRYNQVIRPWKSRLALLYVDGRPGIATDIRIVKLTALAITNRQAALRGASELVAELGGDEELRRIALREAPLREAPPPGATAVVQSLA